MGLRRSIAFVALLTLVLAPVLGIAADGFSGPGRAVTRDSGLRHQPPRPWRTVPGVVGLPVAIPRIVPVATLESSELSYAPQLVIRTPFVPPRG